MNGRVHDNVNRAKNAVAQGHATHPDLRRLRRLGKANWTRRAVSSAARAPSRRRSMPVATVEPGASTELGETEPHDGAVLDDPAEVVAGAVAGRPERTEVTVVVDVPLAPGRTTLFDVRGPAV